MNITLSAQALDGLIEAGNRNGTTAEAIATELLENQGNSYAELFKVGVITSAAFMARFHPAEYAAIMGAAEQSPEVADYIKQLTEHATVPLNDPRLAEAVNALAAAGLIQASRVPEILFYQRPVPAGK